MKHCFESYSSRQCFSTGKYSKESSISGIDPGCFTTPNITGGYSSRHEKKEVAFTTDSLWVKFLTYVGDMNGDMIAIGQLRFIEQDGDNNDVEVWKDAIFRILIEASFQDKTFSVLGGWSEYMLLSTFGIELDDIDYLSGFTAKTFGYSLTPSVQFRANGMMYWLDSFSFALKGTGGGTYFGKNDYEYLSEDQTGTPSINGIGGVIRRYRTPLGRYSKAFAQEALYFDRTVCEIKILDTADVVDIEYEYTGAKKIENIYGDKKWLSLSEIVCSHECDVNELPSFYAKKCNDVEYIIPGVSKKEISITCYQNGDPAVLVRGDSVFIGNDVFEYRHNDVITRSVMNVKYDGSTTWDCDKPVWFEYTTTTARVIGGDPVFKSVGPISYGTIESDNYITSFVGNDLRIFKKMNEKVIYRDIGKKYAGALYDMENIVVACTYNENEKKSFFMHYWVE